MLSVDVLQSCFEENQEDSYVLLLREIPEYNNLNAIKMISNYDHINLVNCACTQSLLSKIWYGQIFEDAPNLNVKKNNI